VKAFADNNFLLCNETAKTLYHDYASKVAVIDYHCHVDPKEIAQNRRFDNLTQIWLGGDHYKWRLMRANGEDEKLVTGSESSDYDKFLAFARAIPKAIGNPIYHWTHLELKRYFDCDLTVSPETADEIWQHCNSRLAEDTMSVRGIIEKSKVVAIATTDDPIDTLEWHKMLAEDNTLKTKVLPTFRPDKAVNIDKPTFFDYLKTLQSVSGVQIKSLDDLYAALESRMDFFDTMGCLTSDHGLDYVPFEANAQTYAPGVFLKAYSGDKLTALEINQYKTALMTFLGKQYSKRGWVMQLHYGALRNVNSSMFAKLGPDTGYDAISSYECSRNIASFLDFLEQTNELPKTVLYSLNPNDDAMLVSIAGCFPGNSIMSKVQHGSAWWFNDTKPAMEAQLINLASGGLLGNFIGMLTDSRSFLSYTRHEYFRRILCNLIGNWVECGEYPNDLKSLGEMVSNISYFNALNYFGFNKV